ncbi:MAG: hypothetical protein ABIV48_07365, partial [Pyrinomonadaceae bacterium]
EMFLVKMNFVAFMTALQSLATGSERTQDPSIYIGLPENSSGGLVNFVFRNANIVNITDATTISVADIAAVTERRRASFAAPTKIRSVGNLPFLRGLEEYDAASFNVAQRFGVIKSGELAEFYFYRTTRAVNWMSAALEKEYPPDAIFSNGRWLKGEKVVPKR